MYDKEELEKLLKEQKQLIERAKDLQNQAGDKARRENVRRQIMLGKDIENAVGHSVTEEEKEKLLLFVRKGDFVPAGNAGILERIGRVLENILGRELQEKDILLFRKWTEYQEAGGYISKALNQDHYDPVDNGSDLINLTI